MLAAFEAAKQGIDTRNQSLSNSGHSFGRSAHAHRSLPTSV